MSLINYTEPVNIGNIFLGLFGGIATLVVLGVCIYILFRFARPMYKWVEGIYNHDNKYWILEEKMLDEIAKGKGIDLDAELLKREVTVKTSKSFRKQVEEEMFKKMFGEEKKK